MRELREARGLSQASLAELLAGVHDIKLDGTAITRMERGGRTIRLSEAAAIAALFSVTLDQMLSPALPVEEALRRAEDHYAQAKAVAEAATLESVLAEDRVNRLAEIAQQQADRGE